MIRFVCRGRNHVARRSKSLQSGANSFAFVKNVCSLMSEGASTRQCFPLYSPYCIQLHSYSSQQQKKEICDQLENSKNDRNDIKSSDKIENENETKDIKRDSINNDEYNVESPPRHATYYPLINESTILSEIDSAIGVSKPPSLEYLYVVPSIQFKISKVWSILNPSKYIYSSSNPYGHAAIRYTLSNGKQYVMNIVGKPTKTMVNLMSPIDYLFGNPLLTSELGSEQGGVYERSIIGFRLENYPSKEIDKMHEYFKQLQKLEVSNNIKFNLFSIDLNIFNYFPFNILLGRYVEKGNCSYWTSNGLCHANVFKKPTIFPKYLFVKFYMKALYSWGWNGISGKNYRKFGVKPINIDEKHGNSSSSDSDSDASKESENVSRTIATIGSNIMNDENDKTGEELLFENETDNKMPEYPRHCTIVCYNNVNNTKEKDSIDPKGWINPFLFSKTNRNFRNLKLLAHFNVDLHLQCKDAPNTGIKDDILKNENFRNKLYYRAVVTQCQSWVPPKWINSGNVWEYDEKRKPKPRIKNHDSNQIKPA